MAGRTLDTQGTVHSFDKPLGNGEAEARAAKLARRRGIGLLEVAEDARLVLGRQPDAGVANAETNAVALERRLDDDGDTAGFGELPGVARQIQQNLAQPRGIADDRRRQALVDEGADVDT